MVVVEKQQSHFHSFHIIIIFISIIYFWYLQRLFSLNNDDDDFILSPFVQYPVFVCVCPPLHLLFNGNQVEIGSWMSWGVIWHTDVVDTQKKTNTRHLNPKYQISIQRMYHILLLLSNKYFFSRFHNRNYFSMFRSSLLRQRPFFDVCKFCAMDDVWMLGNWKYGVCVCAETNTTNALLLLISDIMRNTEMSGN